MRLLKPLALLAVLAATPAHADSTTGTVVAFDRVDLVLVLEDKTIWEIVPADLALPGEVGIGLELVADDLKAGDEITMDFESAGESGVGKINSITRTGG